MEKLKGLLQMKKKEITNKLKSLNLDFEYIITFDSALVMLGIKKECDYIFLSCNKTDIKNFDNIVFINNNYDIKNIVKIHNFNVANENIFLISIYKVWIILYLCKAFNVSYYNS